MHSSLDKAREHLKQLEIESAADELVKYTLDNLESGGGDVLPLEAYNLILSTFHDHDIVHSPKFWTLVEILDSEWCTLDQQQRRMIVHLLPRSFRRLKYEMNVFMVAMIYGRHAECETAYDNIYTMHLQIVPQLRGALAPALDVLAQRCNTNPIKAQVISLKDKCQ